DPRFAEARGIGRFFDQADGRHDHSGRADSALRATHFEKRALNGVELFAAFGRDSLDRPDSRALRLSDRNEAAVDELAVDQNRARTAFPFSATFFGSGQTRFLAKHVKKASH